MTQGSDPYSLRHQDQRGAGDADQAELAAFKSGSTAIESGIYDDRVAGALDDFAPDTSTEMPSWQENDLIFDSAVGRVQEEIERRQKILGESYPFAFERGVLRHRDDHNLIYDFCLAICNAESLTKGRFKDLPRVFERISAQIVRSYFGEHSDGIHVGFPRDASVGKSFKKAMEYLSMRTGEWVWGPEDGLPDKPSKGDEGVDFVVWLDAPDDRRIGQLFVLGQCACGNDWHTKFDDLNLGKLRKWFHPIPVFEPIRTFTTPRHITDALLREASREAGLVFDRARLVLAAATDDAQARLGPFKPKMRSLISLVVN